MSLSFPNVSLLGYTQDSRFFGAGFQYAATRHLTIQGLLTDLTQSLGITGVWSGNAGLTATVLNNSRDYQDLLLNGISFGSGRVESISFEPGIDVRTKGYQANITVFDSGNLFNLTGYFYSGVNLSNAQYIDAFSETYAFDKRQNGGYAYSHNANVRFTSGVGQLNAIQAAQAVALSLFTGSNLGLAFYSGYTNKQGKRFVTESYNLIDNNCSFQETFDFDSDAGNYSVLRTQAFELGENGVINVSEQATIRGIENPNYQKALSAVGTEMTGAYLRCSGLQSFYYPTGVILAVAPIVQGKTLDIFGNVVTYTLGFTNNPNNQGTYLWDYTQSMTRQNGITNITEDGNIIGRGGDRITAFANAQNGLVIVRGGIQTRITALFVEITQSAVNFLLSKNESNSPYQGTCAYSYTYSNDPALVSNLGIRRIEVTDETAASVYSYNKVGTFGSFGAGGKEIAQNDYQSTVGSDRIHVTLNGDKTVGLTSYLTSALTVLNSRIPAGNDRYIGDLSYIYDVNGGQVDVSITWLYNKSAFQTISP